MVAIWRAVPLGAAFCSALPVDWQAAAAPLVTLLGSNPAIPPTLAALDPIAAVCWYASSRLAAPLFIARTTGAMPPDAGQLLAQLAEKSWSASAAPAAGNDGESQVPCRHCGVAPRHSPARRRRARLRAGAGPARGADPLFPPTVARSTRR
jgi:uncharacterized protein YfaA (DUF2138 family)